MFNLFTIAYTKDLLVENNIQARLQCLNTIPTIVIEDQNMLLLQEFSNIEMHRATMDFPKHTAPRIDGILMEFFHEMWQEVGEDIKNHLRETFQEGRMHKELKVGLQSLIPKQGDHSLITNYRPISMLGFTYKIASKTLVSKVQSSLPLWIRPTQMGFVHGRFILDNVFLAFEAMEWTNESDQNLVMLLFNFEKAYDRIN
jgi:hypothetical protein